MKSQFFRCFVAGSTISDGRTITPEMIDQIVETFNAETYTPRINVEHMKGYSPEPPFNGYGSVVAVKAQADEITIDGKPEKRRALYAQVDGNAQLVKLAKADQKPFPSVELTPSYAGIDKVGLIGLAFTDSPASIATQRLQFSRSAPGTFHAHGADAVALEFEADPAADIGKVEGAVAGFFSALTARFATKEPEKAREEPKPKPEAANDNFAAFAADMITAVKPAHHRVLALIAIKHAALLNDRPQSGEVCRQSGLAEVGRLRPGRFRCPRRASQRGGKRTFGGFNIAIGRKARPIGNSAIARRLHTVS